MTQLNERPKDFDARVMAYVPGLRKEAARRVPHEYRNDLVTDTIMYALERWQNFREDGDMWYWLVWTMRGILKNGAVKAAYRKRTAFFVPIDDHKSLPSAATQEDYAELSETLSALSSVRGGDILLRRAMGDTFAEIGEGRSVSRQRIQQLEVEARACLARRMRRVV